MQRVVATHRIIYGTFHYTRISTKVGPKICKVLPAFHGLTGSDATSTLAEVGKKRAYNILEDSEIHQQSLSQLGQITLTEDVIKQCVKFVFSLYPTTKKPRRALTSRDIYCFAKGDKKVRPFHPHRTASFSI